MKFPTKCVDQLEAMNIKIESIRKEDSYFNNNIRFSILIKRLEDLVFPTVGSITYAYRLERSCSIVIRVFNKKNKDYDFYSAMIDLNKFLLKDQPKKYSDNFELKKYLAYSLNKNDNSKNGLWMPYCLLLNNEKNKNKALYNQQECMDKFIETYGLPEEFKSEIMNEIINKIRYLINHKVTKKPSYQYSNKSVKMSETDGWLLDYHNESEEDNTDKQQDKSNQSFLNITSTRGLFMDATLSKDENDPEEILELLLKNDTDRYPIYSCPEPAGIMVESDKLQLAFEKMAEYDKETLESVHEYNLAYENETEESISEASMLANSLIIKKL